MKHARIPVCYFPTTAFLVDDSKRFLTNISFQLNEQLAYLLFSNPERALYYLQSEYKNNSTINNCLTTSHDIEGHPLSYHAVNLDVGAIHQEIYNPNRFNDITVLLIDYSMPNIDGIQFCEALQNTRFKKIMLTGEADQNLAVKAFNKGIIDKFILKSDSDLGETINSSIKELQKAFFQEASEGVARPLATEPCYCLEDPAFIKLFETLCKENKIVEYYLIESSGSFLMLDKVGKPHWLIVKNHEELQMYYDFAEDSKAPKTLLEQIKTGQKIPYFNHINNCQKVSGNDWKAYLHPAQKLVGKQTYYYALVNKVKDVDFASKKILSYEDYLSNVWPPN